tara:strand:- start:167 stop:400 length:234 start_codon:yes stop_codon:yes gene_type:complete
MASKAQKEYRRAIIGVLEDEGVLTWVEGYGKRHPYFEFHVSGRRIRIAYPTSPSDSQRGIKNIRSEIRRHIREAREG